MSTRTPLTAEQYDATVEALKEVIDPELSVNIWDLGLVYDIQSGTSDVGKHLALTMTLTTPACPLSDIIEAEISKAIDGLYDSFAIDWVWLPPWNASLVTDEGKEMLRAVGFKL